MALPLAADLGKGEATLDAVEPGIHPIHADRMFGELYTDIGDRPLQATNALCQFFEPQIHEVEPLMDAGELGPQRGQHFRFGCHWESL
jgi:hypothetical protein